jgi:hypothetical protein
MLVAGNEQPAGEIAARSATKNASGRSVSGWEIGVDARGKTAARRRHELGYAALPGHEPPSRSERSGMKTPQKLSAPPPGGAEHHQIDASTKVRKSLDTTKGLFFSADTPKVRLRQTSFNSGSFHCISNREDLNQKRSLGNSPSVLISCLFCVRETHASATQSDPLLLPTRNGPCREDGALHWEYLF